jgi:hypothetical protein
MALDTSQPTDEQLRDQPLAFLQEELPAGWIEAIDSGDEDRASALRRTLNYPIGARDSATPDTPHPPGLLSTAPGYRSPPGRPSTSTRS